MVTEGATVPRSRSRGPGLGRNYRYLLSAYSIQTLGEGVVIAALPLLASKLTSDPRLISWVPLATELPWLLLALVGGVIVDRYDRRRLMIGAQAAQTFLLVTVALVVTLGGTQIWMIYVLAFGLCVGDIIFMGSSRALIPTIVRSADLEAANGRNVTAETLGRMFIGPALGSALFVLLVPLPLWVNAATYLVSLLLLSRIRNSAGHFRAVPTGTDRRARAGEEPSSDAATDAATDTVTDTVTGAVTDGSRTRERRGVPAEMMEGVRWLAGHRVLRVTVILAATSNFSVFMAQSVTVLFAKDVLGVGDAGYGILVAAMAIGGVVGGLVSRRVVGHFGTRSVVIGVSVASALSLVAIGLFGRQPVVVVALFGIWSAGLSIWNVMAQSLSQRLIPNELMGRVGSATRMIAFGALPLGALAGGLVAAAYGLTAPWVAGGVVHLVVTLLTLPALLRWPAVIEAPATSVPMMEDARETN
ncbi:MFS transporter [Streptosporangium sp. NPDC051022]|uniref:MFS transporter n=1 Tax=Streptosporangium sp. NPDC051022 TaxID=3155752 RepID=UPI00343BC39A